MKLVFPEKAGASSTQGASSTPGASPSQDSSFPWNVRSLSTTISRIQLRADGIARNFKISIVLKGGSKFKLFSQYFRIYLSGSRDGRFITTFLEDIAQGLLVVGIHYPVF